MSDSHSRAAGFETIDDGQAPATRPASRTGNGAKPTATQPPRRAGDRGTWLIVIGMLLAAGLVIGLLAMPDSRPEPKGTPVPNGEVARIVGSVEGLFTPSANSLPVILGKLVLAALLGALIGYRQCLHVEEYIIQAHVIISFTGALMMIIIGNELARAFGLLGAGSIIRYRTPVRDPKALASLFVTMAVGIAVGIGLFELALIGAVLVVLFQGFLGTLTGWLPATLYNPQRGYTLTLTTEDGGLTMIRLKQAFAEHDIRYKLLEYDARVGKQDGLIKLTLMVEAAASLTTEQLTQLVFREGIRSATWAEEA